MRVRDLMTTSVFTIRLDKRLLAVGEIMRGQHIHHIPVVDNAGHLVGILSYRDLMGAGISTLASKIAEVDRRQHLAVSDVESAMHRDVTTIGPDESVQAAARLMAEKGVGCLPVLEAGRLVGIITKLDFIRLVEQLPDSAFPPPRSE